MPHFVLHCQLVDLLFHYILTFLILFGGSFELIYVLNEGNVEKIGYLLTTYNNVVRCPNVELDLLLGKVCSCLLSHMKLA